MVSDVEKDCNVIVLFVTTVLHPLRVTVDVTVVSLVLDTVDVLEKAVSFTIHTKRLQSGRSGVDGIAVVGVGDDGLLVGNGVYAIGSLDGMLLLGKHVTGAGNGAQGAEGGAETDGTLEGYTNGDNETLDLGA